MKEDLLCESWLVRVLGDPVEYMITDLLLRHGQLSLVEITRRIRRSKSTISHHLSILRGFDIVRNEVEADGLFYWVKYPEGLRVIPASLRQFGA